MKVKDLSVEVVFAAAQAYCSEALARHPDRYNVHSRPRFYSTELLKRLGLEGHRSTVLAILRRLCEELVAADRLVTCNYGARSEYTVLTDEMKLERMRVAAEHARAEELAELLGGEADHHSTGSTLTLTVAAAEQVIAKLRRAL